MKNKIDNILNILKQRKYLTVAVITFILFASIIKYFNDIELQVGNIGKLAYLQLATDIVIAVLFSIFIALFVYRYDQTKQFNEKRGFVGGFLGTLVFGCAACNITLAGYLGLAGILSLFPLYGYELKAIGLVILLISISRISNLTCKIKN